MAGNALKTSHSELFSEGNDVGWFGNRSQYRALQDVIQHVSLHNIFFILVFKCNVNLHIKNANYPMYESGVKSGCKRVNG
ncbi:hypothetical protein ACUND9_27745, partial [Serratia sp. IR-2025]